MTAEKAPDRSALVLRLGVTGELGQMDYSAVLGALQGSFDLLRRTAHRVLGDRADALRWQLTGVLEGSVMTLVQTTETDEVTGRELYEIAETYTRDLAQPADRLPEEDVPILRELLKQLQEAGSGNLLAQVEGSVAPNGGALLVPDVVLPTLTARPTPRQQVIGSVTGHLESLHVHARREASLWNELDQRRVVVSFVERDYERVHRALRQRVEAFGVIQEDADGRALRMRL